MVWFLGLMPYQPWSFIHCQIYPSERKEVILSNSLLHERIRGFKLFLKVLVRKLTQ